MQNQRHHLDDTTITVPADASKAQTAAILAAITTYRAAIDRDDRSEETDETDPWAFAGRLDATGRQVIRIPPAVPNDRWTAAGRSDRF